MSAVGSFSVTLREGHASPDVSRNRTTSSSVTLREGCASPELLPKRHLKPLKFERFHKLLTIAQRVTKRPFFGQKASAGFFGRGMPLPNSCRTNETVHNLGGFRTHFGEVSGGACPSRSVTEAKCKLNFFGDASGMACLSRSVTENIQRRHFFREHSGEARLSRNAAEMKPPNRIQGTK